MLSNRLHTIEGIILIILCTSFFLHIIQDESNTNWLRHSSFLVCVAIGFYEVIALFIFLFFYQLATKDKEFGWITVKILKISLLIFCMILSLSFIKERKRNM
ncbi:MAG: hypothetical protein JJE22_17675 [Bacteroidia bacterium]|nr:hypothetical protein [Bacteroidia bacterium]